MATVVEKPTHGGGSGLMLAVAIVVALLALVAVNFAYNRQGISETPAIETPGAPPPPATPQQ